jgi:hypothetical protein
MRSSGPGKTISASVEGISPFGVWLLAGGKEYFLSFREFPHFRAQSIQAVMNVRLLHGYHLYWPELDVDLELDNLEHPERYPLKARPRRSAAQPKKNYCTRR